MNMAIRVMRFGASHLGTKSQLYHLQLHHPEQVLTLSEPPVIHLQMRLRIPAPYRHKDYEVMPVKH